MEEFNKEPNKFQKWEIVTILNEDNKDGEIEQGFITKIRQFSWNGLWEYSVYEYEYGSVVEYLEHQLESTGEFLSQEEVDDRLNIISRKNKFNFKEIVKIVNCDETEYIGHKGYIKGMVQCYDTGKWTYSITTLIDDEYVPNFEEKDLVSTGEFMPKGETMSNMSLKVTTKGEVTDVKIDNPKSWEDRIIASKWNNNG